MVKKIIFGSIIALGLAFMFVPIILLMIFSFSESARISFESYQFGFGVYERLFSDRDLWSAVFNTLFIAVTSSLIATIIATMACVGIVRLRRRTRGAVMGLTLVPLINAAIVTSFALLIFFTTVGFMHMDFLRLILAHTLICLPVAVLVMLPRVRSLDPSLFDAATDLGARPSVALFTVVIPQLIPTMIGAFLVGFTLSLDDFIITHYNSGGIQTISTFVLTRVRNPDVAEFRALSTIVFVAVLLGLVAVNIYQSRKRKRRKEV